MIAERFPELFELTLEEKKELASELAMEINAVENVDKPPTEELIAAINERLELSKGQPTFTWEEVVEKIKKG